MGTVHWHHIKGSLVGEGAAVVAEWWGQRVVGVRRQALRNPHFPFVCVRACARARVCACARVFSLLLLRPLKLSRQCGGKHSLAVKCIIPLQFP